MVVNHHLLCADLAVKESSYGEVIPEYDTVILDEAHLLEDVATQYFGVAGLVAPHRGPVPRRRARAEGGAPRRARGAAPRWRRVRHRAERLFSCWRASRGRRLGPGLDDAARWRRRRRRSCSRLEGLRTAHPGHPRAAGAADAASPRAPRRCATSCASCCAAEDDGHVYFVETRGRGVFLRATPIDVSRDPARAAVRPRARGRAHLGHPGRGRRLRVPERAAGPRPSATSCTLASPFDFATPGGPLRAARACPIRASPAFVVRAAAEVTCAARAISRGRAFVLFTSYANMNAVARAARRRGAVPDPHAGRGAQGRCCSTRSARTPGAVLLATSSFWQGVDVAGEQLSCVIIDKLPFASPADPVVAARIDRLRNRGGNPFADYQVPVAVLMLKQGLGRLIRSGSRPRRPGRARQPPRREVLRPALPGQPAARAAHPRPRRRAAVLRGGRGNLSACSRRPTKRLFAPPIA